MPAMAQKQNENMTPKEVADYLGMAESTVLQWLREGKLPGYRFGYRWKVKRAELETWENHRRNIKGPNV